MIEHRWSIPCPLTPDECQNRLESVVRQFERKGWTVFEQVDTGGFFGWTLRKIQDAVGIAVPQPGEEPELRVRASKREQGELIVDKLTSEGPLAGRDAKHEEHELQGV